MKDLIICKNKMTKIKFLNFLKLFGKGLTTFRVHFQRRPLNLWKMYLLEILLSTIKRRLVGENVINIFGNGTEHIF